MGHKIGCVQNATVFIEIHNNFNILIHNKFKTTPLDLPWKSRYKFHSF